jgi:putative NADH-flavin reductase
VKIVIFGTGFVGGALIREFAQRGHEVTAVSRSASTGLPPNVNPVIGDVHDDALIDSVTADKDAIVSALPARAGDSSLSDAVAILIRAADATGVRLGVVGGASIIPVHEGEPVEGDTPKFPAQFAPLHHAHQEALSVLASAPDSVDWFYLIPAGEFGPHNPGTRTGAYRTSSTSQVTNDAGHSLLGVEDYAIAFADELEHPLTHRAWLAIGY